MAALTASFVAAPAAFGATTSLKAAKTPSSFATKTVSNGSRVSCFKVWNPIDNKKFETLSYLPPLDDNAIAREIHYLLSKGWVPCLEFDAVGFIYRENNNSPGYYDGRYWTMWKLPLFGCTDPGQVLRELAECRAAYPDCFIRILGFDNKKQVQCTSFIAHKPGQVASSYSAPAPSYSAPAPSYGAPSYGAPSYGAPAYGAPPQDQGYGYGARPY